MYRVSRLLVAAALTLAVAAPASAAGLAPLFTVSGVINNGSLGTYFACTNTDTAPNAMSVAIFGQAGSLINTSSTISVAPQGSVLFGTSAAAGFSVDTTVGTPLMDKGSAQISTTSKKVVCTAFLATVTGDPPTTMMQLTVAAKGKQKGD